MRPTPLLRLAQTGQNQAAAATAAAVQPHAYRPLIKFKGHHEHPAPSTSSAPEPHPASPHATLPDSFAKYREKVTQHGPLAGRSSHAGSSGSGVGSQSRASSTSNTSNASAPKREARTAAQAGSAPLAFDRSELPARFGRLAWAEGEGEAVESGGASLW